MEHINIANLPGEDEAEEWARQKDIYIYFCSPLPRTYMQHAIVQKWTDGNRAVPMYEKKL